MLKGNPQRILTVKVSTMTEMEVEEMMEFSDVDPEESMDSSDSSLERKNTKEEEGAGSEQGSGEIEGSASITFCPPAYQQRYCRVRDLLEELLESPDYKSLNASTGKTVMEVGCAEFGMMNHLKHILDIGKIIFLDLDRQLMEEKAHYLKPLPAEYLQKKSRPQPLVVEAYSGCITTVDEKLHKDNPDIFAVIGIEIIEHLHADVLRGFEETVFGIISPNIVILTTPNSEFNEVFNLAPGKFRHWDHKFEWSRGEFDLWCRKITAEFQSYTYKIEGICAGPEETKHLGCVSQMAIFQKRQSGRESPSPAHSHHPSSFRIQAGAYSLVRRVEYPNYIETRTPEEITLLEFNYYVNTFLFSKSMIDKYEELGEKVLKVPFSRILSLSQLPNIAKENQEFVRSVLVEAGYEVESEGGQMNVVFDIKEFVAAHFESDKSEVSEEDYISYDLNQLNVNPVTIQEEIWE